MNRSRRIKKFSLCVLCLLYLHTDLRSQTNVAKYFLLLVPGNKRHQSCFLENCFIFSHNSLRWSIKTKAYTHKADIHGKILLPQWNSISYSPGRKTNVWFIHNSEKDNLTSWHTFNDLLLFFINFAEKSQDTQNT